MADLVLKPTTAHAGIAIPGRYGRPGGDPGAIIAERPCVTLKQIAARHGKTDAALKSAREALGIDIDDAPRRAALDGLAVIGTAPGQWLALAEGEKGRGLLARLENALTVFASFVNQSDGKAVLRLWGPRLRDVLAKGCPLDLHERVFRPQDAATTQIALIPCQLWQLDEVPTFELAVPLGYAGSFWSWLTSSAAEFGYEVTPPLSLGGACASLEPGGERMAQGRKLIGFDAETLQALELLARDKRRSLQELADEAFSDLLAKHHRPRGFKEALKESARREPANENRPPRRRGR